MMNTAETLTLTTENIMNVLNNAPYVPSETRLLTGTQLSEAAEFAGIRVRKMNTSSGVQTRFYDPKCQGRYMVFGCNRKGSDVAVTTLVPAHGDEGRVTPGFEARCEELARKAALIAYQARIAGVAPDFSVLAPAPVAVPAVAAPVAAPAQKQYFRGIRGCGNCRALGRMCAQCAHDEYDM